MRRAAALPTVLMSIGLVSALAVGGSFASRRFARNDRIASAGDALNAEAERTAVEAVSVLGVEALDTLRIGTAVDLGERQAGGVSGTVTHAWVTRVSATSYIIVSEARSSVKPFIHKRLSVAVRVDSTVLHPLQGRPWTPLP